MGGTLHVRVEEGGYPFDQPFMALADADAAISIMQSGVELTFVGLRAGMSTVRLEAPDGRTYASFRVTAASIDHIMAVATVHEVIPPGLELALAATYETRAEVRLFNSPLLLDDDIVIVPPPGSVVMDASSYPHYFTFDQAVIGESTVSVMSGGNTYTAPFVHFETVDTIKYIDPDTISIPVMGVPRPTCFAGMNGTRFVQGLMWSYTLEGGSVAPSHMNCVDIHASDDVNSDGMVTIDVSAGGATRQITVPLT